jgi:solute carrier family 12 sodium/potassium/chloride transporter 2
MISRSLGPEFGASVGLVFSMANAVGVALHTVGFAESMNDLLRSQDVKIVDSGTNDIRIVGTIAVCIMLAICIIGMEWEAKVKHLILILF